jgi:hypothetical protein
VLACSDGWRRDEALALLKRFYQRENQHGLTKMAPTLPSTLVLHSW